MTEDKIPVTADEQTRASPYAGRWVARLRGKIIAQGGTPEQALHAAQKSRHKEKPEIIFMPVPFSISPLVDKVPPSCRIKYISSVGQYGISSSARLLTLILLCLPNGISLARRVANALSDFMVLDDRRSDTSS
jgi:hypothetical protein